MAGSDRPRELDQVAVIAKLAVVAHAGLSKRLGFALALDAIGVEEPQAILDDRPTGRRLVRGVVGEGTGALLSARRLERRSDRPVGLVEVRAKAPGEGIGATLGDRVDHATGESAVLGRDPGCEDLHFLDRILDEQVVDRAEEVVVDVDAVDQEHVVVGERAVDHNLIVVRRVVGQPWSELGDGEDVSLDR